MTTTLKITRKIYENKRIHVHTRWTSSTTKIPVKYAEVRKMDGEKTLLRSRVQMWNNKKNTWKKSIDTYQFCARSITLMNIQQLKRILYIYTVFEMIIKINFIIIEEKKTQRKTWKTCGGLPPDKWQPNQVIIFILTINRERERAWTNRQQMTRTHKT